MSTMRRIRNVAFLLLVVALAGTSQAKLSADDGGFFCGYGDCVLTYDNCQGTWDDYYYPEEGLTEPGSCMLIYHIPLLPYPGDSACNISTYAEGQYHWPGTQNGCEPEECPGGGNCKYCTCVQQ